MNPDAHPRKRSRSLVDGLLEVFEKQIQHGQLEPGDKLPTEAVIMAEQGVSRTVVREAISRLQAAGLVKTRHGIGTFVLSPQQQQNRAQLDPATITTLRDVLDILELRTSLEVEAAGLAAQRRTPSQLEAITAALERMRNNSGDESGAVDADFQFHLRIAEATNNRYFGENMNYLGAVMIPRTRVNFAKLSGGSQSEYLSSINREHDDICAAIARQDSDAARAAMRMHLTNSRERLRKLHQQSGGAKAD